MHSLEPEAVSGPQCALGDVLLEAGDVSGLFHQHVQSKVEGLIQNLIIRANDEL